MEEERGNQIIELLWDYMKKDRMYIDRVHTGWGTKTKVGLLNCIDRIMEEKEAA